MMASAFEDRVLLVVGCTWFCVLVFELLAAQGENQTHLRTTPSTLSITANSGRGAHRAKLQTHARYANPLATGGNCTWCLHEHRRHVHSKTELLWIAQSLHGWLEHMTTAGLNTLNRQRQYMILARAISVNKSALEKF
jgi:hypothetical protein